MDAYRSRIKTMIDELRGGDLKAASLAMGKNHAYVHQFLTTGKPRVLPEASRLALAQYLGVEEKVLRPNPTQENENLNLPETTLLRRLPYGPAGERDLPLLGEVVGGDSGEFSLNGHPNEHIVRPEQLKGVLKAYAVYIVGESMEPVALNGQIAYVNPGRPPALNGLVVVEFHDGTACIKTLVRRKADSVVLRQYNPAKDFEVSRSKIKNIHRIVLHGDPA